MPDRRPSLPEAQLRKPKAVPVIPSMPVHGDYYISDSGEVNRRLLEKAHLVKEGKY